MKETCRRLVGFWVVAAALAICIPSDTLAQEETAADALLFLGTAGPNAIPLQISTGKDRSDTFRLGETISLNLRASRQCYVIAVILSADGDASIILPTGESPDNRILPDKEYTLLGASSRVKLTADESLRGAKIIVLAFSRPFKPGPLRVAAGERMISVPRLRGERMRILKEKIEDLSRDDGFNREIFFVKPVGDSAVSLAPIGMLEREKGVEPTKSSKPGGLTGGQGIKSEEKQPDQR